MLSRRRRRDPDDVRYPILVVIAPGQDDRLLESIARPVFGRDVRYTPAGSESALEALRDVGDRYDLAFSQ